MGASVGNKEEGAPMAEINVTPLVDVMLVLLIIFLITVPVVTQSVKVSLPKETNVPRETKPENIEISVTKDGEVYWNTQLVSDSEALVDRLKKVAVLNPQPAVHIRGDDKARYESVGRVMFACQRAGIMKFSFVMQPPERGG